MDRMRAHAIEPGQHGQVLTTADGSVVWAPVPTPPGMGIDDLTDVDTTTRPPTVGQTLAWDDASGQWVPVSVPGVTPDDGSNPPRLTPRVTAASVVHRATDPYNVPLPAGVAGAAFDGKFLVVAHWLNAPTNIDDQLLALTTWTVLAYTNTLRTEPGPYGAILYGDPRDVVTLAVGTGPCELQLIAVEDVAGARGLPLSGVEVLDACNSAAGWTSPYGMPVTVVDGAVSVDSVPELVFEGYQRNGWAMLERPAAVSFTHQPWLTVEWSAENFPPTSRSVLKLEVINADLNRRVEYGRSFVTDLGGGWYRSVYDMTSGNSPVELTHLRFSLGPASDGTTGKFKIRHMEMHPEPHAHVTESTLGSSYETVGHEGVETQAGDLLLAVGGYSNAASTGQLILYNMGGEPEPTLVADSAPSNPSLRTQTKSVPVIVGGVKRPDVSVGQIPARTGVLVMTTALYGPEVEDDGGELPPGGDDGDVLTLVGGQPAWTPPVDGLPDGGTADQVLTIVDGEAVWADPAVPPATRFLVPLTTVVGGVPSLVWTEDHKLMFVEETL